MAEVQLSIKASVEVKADGNKMLPSNDYSFVKVVLIYDVNKMPILELYFRTQSNVSYLNFEECNVKININDAHNFEIEGTVISSAPFKGDMGVLTIVMAKKDKVRELDTKFLGEDANAAIDSLKVLPILTKIESTSGRFFQFNETAVSATMRILQGVAKGQIACITEKGISMVKLDSPSPVHEFVEPTSFIKFQNSNFYKEVEPIIFEGETIQTVSLGEELTATSSNADFAVNVLYNRRYRNPPKFMANLQYDHMFIPYPIGDGMKLRYGDSSIPDGCIIGKIVELSEDDCVTTLLMGAE